MDAAPQSKTLLTPYDILKSIAVPIMVIDYLGTYFFPDNLELRAIGRLCVPIWLFLIGYAHSRRVDGRLIGGALLIAVLDYIIVGDFHGLNILCTIILLRLTLDPLLKWLGTSVPRLTGVTFFCFIFAPLTQLIVDYGTMAYVLAIWGALTRRLVPDEKENPFLALAYGAIALALYTAVEILDFRFNAAEITLLILGNIFNFYALTLYLPRTRHVDMPNAAPWFTSMLSWLGRHSLEFYVCQLLLMYAVIFLTCHLGLIALPVCPKLSP